MIPYFSRHRWLLLLGDVVLILVATLLAPWIRLGQPVNIFHTQTGASTITLLLFLVMLYIFDLYNIDRTFRFWDISLRAAVAVGVAGILSAFLFYSLPHWKYGRGIFLIQMVLVWGSMTGWRCLFSLIFPAVFEKKDVLVLGAGHCGTALYDLLKSPLSPYRVVGFLDDEPAKQGIVIGSPAVLDTTDRLLEIATQKGVKTAILAISHNRSSELISRVLEARLKGLRVIDMPTVCERLTRRVPVDHIRDDWLLFTDGFYLLSKQYVQKVKRLIDFSASALLLLVCAPVLAITALAIRLNSPGPVLFRQKRVGKDGSVFTAWKFRSMQQDAEQNGAVWAEMKDPRVTLVGKWIRLSRIDELPQLINVFRGDMSLIGPRPERPEFVEQLEAQIPYYSLRHTVRPGITGWAQVNYRYGASVEDGRYKLEYDLYYIKNMSLLLDLKIILRTIGVVLFGQGAR